MNSAIRREWQWRMTWVHLELSTLRMEEGVGLDVMESGDSVRLVARHLHHVVELDFCR
jgi:hypothetical protein